MSHQSDSSVQREAEEVIRKAFSTSVGTALTPGPVQLGDATTQVDAVADDESILAEIFARQGRLKPGQQKKVAIDALKLISLGRERPNAALYLVFCDEAAAAYAQGTGWLAQALRAWGVKVVVVDIDADLRERVAASQARQIMINPLLDEDAATDAL